MWNRAEVKNKGKVNFKKNYWKSVLVAFIYSLFFVGSSAAYSTRRQEIQDSSLNDPNVIAILLALLAILGILLIFSTIVDLFLLNPLEVGCNRFFLVNQDQEAPVDELVYSYKNNYWATVVGIFLQTLLITVGFILFIIPGIILLYSTRMVPFILADDPTISATDAIKRSMEMMKGNKWKAFVFDLSFLGWELLGLITCGILDFFYVRPYKLNADAALYQAIRDSSSVQR